uniref:Uncharacterized protein n=1 Tax=uncultured Alphaproteobacteria bacterium TaxID=91750 RepID=A0A6G8F3F4_9PROT|nr:hypothetical protein PlAlph_6000 [uncultured Alphaproteobacteria bacterium]
MPLKQIFRDYFYPDSRIIAQKAAVYDRVPWYRSLRFVPIFLWSLCATWATSYDMESYVEKWTLACGMAIIMLPLIYLGIKGYRWVLLFDILYIVGNQVGAIWQYGFQDWSVVVVPVITCLFVFPLVTAFRIENYRVKNKLAPKRKFWIDVLKAISGTVLISGAIMVVLTVFVNRELKASDNLLERKLEIFIHMGGVEKYCQKHGVKLNIYPQRFMKDYAEQIEEVDRQLGNTLFLKFMVQKAEDEVIRMGLEEKYDRLRKGVIVMQLRKKQNIPDGEFVWKDEYDSLMDGAGYCRFLDNNYDLFKNIGLFKDLDKQGK